MAMLNETELIPHGIYFKNISFVSVAVPTELNKD